MMKDSVKTDVTTAKVTVIEVISGVLGIAMIALGYYMATEMFGTFKALTMAMTSPFIILFLTVVGAYLFFRSSVSLIFKTLKNLKWTRIYYRCCIYIVYYVPNEEKCHVFNYHCNYFCSYSNCIVFRSVI